MLKYIAGASLMLALMSVARCTVETVQWSKHQIHNEQCRNES